MKVLFNYIVLLLGLTASITAHAKVNVFACEPEWQSLADVLGGNKVKTFSATNAFQDPHHIEARPSLIAKVRKADLLVCTGSELEIGWLPLLQRQSANKAIQTGKVGYFMASEIVERLEVPDKLDRSLGDIHASGNPHVHLDPYRMQTIATALSQRLQQIDTDNATYYQTQLSDFITRWQSAIGEWEALASQLKNKKVVIQHRNWSYLLTWLGMQEVADLEPKPGLPPTSSHLVSLLEIIKQQQPDYIVIASYQDDRGAKWLADKSGLPIIKLPFTVGGNKTATDLFTLYSNTLDLLTTHKDAG